MTLSPSLLAGAAFLAAGGLAVVSAQTITRTLEDRSVEAVARELEAQGLGWSEVLGDGLQVILEGEAPSEIARFEAISAASRVVDGARVIDNLRVVEPETAAPPDFALEILRGERGVSVIGLVPAATDRADLAQDIAEAAAGQEVSDLLQTADHPVPAGWEPALDFALDALEMLPRSRISVAAGRVSIEAISDSPEAQRRLESELARMAPDGLRLALAVSAPRPVIAPFTLRARLVDGRLAFDACSADTEAARDAILSAAATAGAQGPVDCRLGLGAPTPDWGAAVATGLAALHELGGGTLTFSDAQVALVAPRGIDRAHFERIAGELDGALPEVFDLEAEQPLPEAEAPDQGPPEFVATLAEDGTVRLRGRTEDARMARLAHAFAQARFGASDVALATRPGAEGLPAGWSMRVLAGIEALSRLADGTVTVTPDLIAVSGRTGREAARDEIAARAIETLGPGAAIEIDVAYDAALDPLAALPSPEECLARITSVTDAAKITFDPGSATISSDGEPVIEAIAEILRSCPDLRLRIAGYTDSQGRESSNLALSRSRAESVLAALRAERVPVLGFEAQGFGEASPIASNETEEGREANRRIEFTLLSLEAADDPTPEPAPGPDAEGEADPDEANPDEADPEALIERPDPPPERPEEVEEEAAAALAEQAPPPAEAEQDGEAEAAPAAGEPLAPEAALAEIAEEDESAALATDPAAAGPAVATDAAVATDGQDPEAAAGAATSPEPSPGSALDPQAAPPAVPEFQGPPRPPGPAQAEPSTVAPVSDPVPAAGADPEGVAPDAGTTEDGTAEPDDADAAADVEADDAPSGDGEVGGDRATNEPAAD